MLKKLHQFVLFLLVMFIFPVNKLYATDIFFDDFSAANNSFWKYQLNGGAITYSDGVMNVKSTALRFPFITSSEIKNVRNYKDAVIEFKFSYASSGYMGNGIGVGYSGSNDFPYYQFSIWNDLNTGPVFQYRNTKVDANGVCNYYSVPLLKKPITIDTNGKNWHLFKIIKKGSSYVVSIDLNDVFSTDDNQCVPENVFIGNPLSGGRTDWNILNIDYFKIYDLEPKKNKIIVIPGLGASWNPQAILNNYTIPADQWNMTPFVKNYDLLIKGLEDNGLVKGQDFYVWNYDWRKPLSNIVADFNSYVNSLNLPSGQKIDLVGHSLGGLVARLWTQDRPEVVDRTITLGSPHFGAVRAYEAWNGVKISDSLNASSIGLNVLLQLQKRNNDTLVQTLRNYAPIVFDLSPTFSFLKKNGNLVASKFSQYLSLKNSQISAINNKLFTVDGVGIGTEEWVNVGDRSLFDKLLGIWEDGRPLSYQNGEGDGTVLKKSALISGGESKEYISEHGELVDKSANWVLSKLGLGVTVNSNKIYPMKQAIFYSDSPATMNVNCDGVIKSEILGWVVFEDKSINICQVKFVGKNGGGVYKLVVGGDRGWSYFEDKIFDGQTVNIVINNIDVYWQVLKKDFTDLNLSIGIEAIDRKDVLTVIDEYMKYRTLFKNYRYGEEILEKIRFILDTKIFSETETNNMYTKALASKSLVETNLRLMSRKGLMPKYSDAINYEQANNLMSYGKNYPANYLASKLYGIVWK